MLEFQQCIDRIVPSVSMKGIYEEAAWLAYEETSRFKGLRVVSIQSIDPSTYKLAHRSLLSAGVSAFVEGHERFVMPDAHLLSMTIEALASLPGTLSIRQKTLQASLDAMHAANLHTVRDVYNISVVGLATKLPEGHAMYFAERLDGYNLYMPFQFKSEILI